MGRWVIVFLWVFWALGAGAAHAGEADLRQAFQKKFPQAAIESVSRTLYDMRGAERRNLTQERGAQLAAQSLEQSKALAVKRVRGNGKRVIYTFEDPNCSYCRRLQKELVKINDVTIYTFLWPILSADSVAKSKMVWCAKDRGKAWDDLMSRGIAPQNDGKCANPLAKNAELAQRFGVRGTPAIYLTNGRQIGGFLEAAKLEQALVSASSK